MRPTEAYARHLTRKYLAPSVVILLLHWAVVPASAGKVTASKGHLDLPTYPWAAAKHPYFRGTDKVNIYPYPMLDFLSREVTNRTFKTVVLENEYLRITFLPELGGKIHEVIDKTTGQPMFYVNHVIKPGLIGQCGAWTSGGVEWNTGPQGHTVGCMQPVAVEILPAEKDGSRSVAIGETERIYGTRWTVVVTLRPGRSFIEERIRIYNPTETIRPYYFWNCTAAPNTPGFRFVYPMTLGCDHAGEKFFQWPIDNGKDLSRGTNYQDASSIFAWHCDQDFFGSYYDDLDRGVVSFANHYQLPGKKAWTWGYGGFGKMHQADLTDNDGPYNEVQTGPLLTQAQVGRLDPCEAVEWKEWWYPVHGIGGFVFATKDAAINVTEKERNLHFKIIGTGTWSPVQVRLLGTTETVAECKLSPNGVTEIDVPIVRGVKGATLVAGNTTLASFKYPLNLPRRTPPEKPPKPETPSEIVAAGWQEFLFAHYSEAEAQFRKALEKDPKSAAARTGLAFLQLDPDPMGAAREAEAAVQANPDDGLARFALAVAKYRLSSPGDIPATLENAWFAARDQETAIPARALIAKLLIARLSKLDAVEAALAGPGPWETDVLCRNLRAFALLKNHNREKAVELVHANLEVEPLDLFSRALLWLADAEGPSRLKELLHGNAQLAVDLAMRFVELEDYGAALHVLGVYFEQVPAPERDPLPAYLAWALACQGQSSGQPVSPTPMLGEAYKFAQKQHIGGVLPYWAGSGDPLSPLASTNSDRDRPDGKAALYVGDRLFHLGRYAEGREMWKRAAELGAEPVIAYRALGMAAKTLDGDLKTAREWLEKANQADPKDAIVARDLANAFVAASDKCESDSEKNELITKARDCLKAAFDEGKGRSDFVALLARCQNRLGDFTATARMLDTVRVTVWEGAHDVHDLFEQAHLALGEANLKAGHPADALAEFDHALEYPANLATGKLENAREAHIHYQRGNALDALGRNNEALTAWKLAANEPGSKDTKVEESRQKAKEALEKASK